MSYSAKLEENNGYQKTQVVARKKSKAIYTSSYHLDELVYYMDQGYCIIEIIFDTNNAPYDYRFIEVNPAFEKHTGLKDAKGKFIRELKPDHEQFWIDTYGQIAITGESKRFEGWAAQLDRYYEVYAFRVNDPTKKKIAVLFTDATQKKRSENNLTFLFDLSKILIVPLDTVKTIEEAGRMISDYLHLSYFVFAKLLKQENKIEVIYNWHLTDQPDLKGVYGIADFVTENAGIENQKPETFIVHSTIDDERINKEAYKKLSIGSFITIPLKRSDDSEYLISVCRQKEGQWRPDEIQLVKEAAQNVWTNLERQRIERELYYSEERLRLAIETGKVGICDFDYNSGTSYCNEVRYALYGMLPTHDQTHVEEFFSRTHSDDLEALKENVYLGIETTGKFNAEFRVIHPDGTIRWISEKGQVTEWEEGKPRRVISTLIDITQRKTEELQRDDFFKIASHELKTPITNIKGLSYMLENSMEEGYDSLRIELNKQLTRQIDRLNRLVSNMLDAARAAAGRLDYDMKRLQIMPILQEVIQDIQNTTENHKLRLSVVPLPDVKGDSMRIAQVFSNLITNAIKYTPAVRNEKQEILIDAHQIGNEVRITVTDKGIGMSAGTQARLFERFFRSDTPETHHYSGLGLGLYISKEIVHEHGGEIDVRSRKGEGSVFTIIFPVLP